MSYFILFEHINNNDNNDPPKRPNEQPTISVYLSYFTQSKLTRQKPWGYQLTAILDDSYSKFWNISAFFPVFFLSFSSTKVRDEKCMFIPHITQHSMMNISSSFLIQWNLIYNEVFGTMKITLLYQVSHYIRVNKQRTIKSWDQQNYVVIRGFCYTFVSDLFITSFPCRISCMWQCVYLVSNREQRKRLLACCPFSPLGPVGPVGPPGPWKKNKKKN